MGFSAYVLTLMIVLFAIVQPAHAWDGGDTVALLLGLVLLFVVTCAGLGWWSRRSGSGYVETE